MALYVDDAILASPPKRAIESMIAVLSRTFELKIGDTTTFVGIEINRDEWTRSDCHRLITFASFLRHSIS